MRYILSVALLIVGILCLEQRPRAQLSMTGVGGGFGGAAAYQGPGDIIPGAIAWWGLRCYTAAYTGNVADIYSPSDALHTLLTCSIGGGINETITPLATTCAVSCTVQTLYDQAGLTSCDNGVPAECDAIEATEANRPTLSLSCVGGRYCMQGSGSQALKTPALASPASQPNFVAQVVDRTGNFTSTSGVFGDINGLAAFDFANSTNMLLLYAGASLTATAADSTWHTVQFTLNGGSSEIIVDGGTPTTGAAGAGVMSAALLIFKEGFGNFLVGNITEMGLWSGTQSAPDKASLNANQRAYWGF